MSEVKAELKLTKDFIKKKDYKEAYKHCKNVLKTDKENYNALVFFGVCATELNHYDQAKKAYEKAIEKNKDDILAWQGLCSLLERMKNDTYNGELIKTYKTLLEKYPRDDRKFIDTSKRLLAILQQEKKLSEVVEYQKKVILKYSGGSDIVEAWKTIISTLTTMLEREENMEEKAKIVFELFKAYNCLITETDKWSIEAEKEHEKFIQFLLKFNRIKHSELPSLTEILSLLTKFHRKYESNAEILKNLCTALVNHYFVTNILTDESRQYFEKYLQMETDNDFNSIIKAVTEYSKSCYETALQFFSNDCKNPVILYFRGRCHYQMHCHRKVQSVINQCRVNTEQTVFQETRNLLERKLIVLELQVMLAAEKIVTEKVVMMMEKINLDENNIDDLLLRMEAHLRLGQYDSFKEDLAKNEVLEEKMTSEQKLKHLQLKAEASFVEKQFFDAEIRLQETFRIMDNSRSRFLLGKVYWYLGESENDYYKMAYTEFLKAAKMDPLYSQTFVFLGLYQKLLIKDITKALKCFEKAISLDSSNSEAGRNIGDIYLQLDQEEKALQVYLGIVSKSEVGEAGWAWMRLGLIYLKQENADQAIVCFQRALRGEPDISHYWECLGDAYFMKGSYTSSMKAFTKSLQLDSSSMYCKHKIGQIRQMLCLAVEAIEAYTDLLKGHPNYVPALLGLAQCYHHLQKESLKMTFDGRAVSQAQQVVNHLARAIETEPRYTCLWKTLADSLTSLHNANDDKCRLSIPAALQRFVSFQVEGVADKPAIMEIASRCFMMAVKLREDIACFWHDLAVCTYRYGKILQGEAGREKILHSIQIVKKAIQLDCSNHTFWNSLGVMTGCSISSQCCGHSIDDIQNPGLSQHAFIKALEINAQDALVWANLGVLYLKHDQVKAAHEAFKKAQACDPLLVQGWVGQAYIAESIGDEDAMDLFRHSTELDFHGESSLAYAQWVCRLLHINEKESILLSTKPRPDLSHLPTRSRKMVRNASVALQKLTERHKVDPWLYNTLGNLLEHEALYKKAEKAFECARKLLTESSSDTGQTEILRKVLLNQARVLCELKEFESAIEIYNISCPQTSNGICGVALAYFGSGNLKKSQEAYEKALTLSTVDSESSSILTALGMVSYALRNSDAAKALLFKSSQMKQCSEHGLMALSSLGLMSGDGTLATAALMELAKHPLRDTESYDVKRTKLMTCFHLLQGQTKAAQRTINKAIMRYPNNSTLWSDLANFFLQHVPSNMKGALHCMAVTRCKGPSQIVSKRKATVSLGFPVSTPRDALRAAQRLVHSQPENAESWVLLSTALLTSSILEKDQQQAEHSVVRFTHLALEKVDQQLNVLKKQCQAFAPKDKICLTTYSRLYSWMMKSFVLTSIYYGDVTAAQTFCDKIIMSLNGDKTQEDFLFLKGLAKNQLQHPNLERESSHENLPFMATVASRSSAPWIWQILAQLYERMSMPEHAECCYREIIKQLIQNGGLIFPALFKLCMLCIKSYSISKADMWLKHASDTMSELVKLKEDSDLLTLLRAVLFYQQGNKKAALKYVGKLTFVSCHELSTIQEKLLQAWK